MPQKKNIQPTEPAVQAFGYNGLKNYSIWQNDNRKKWLALALLIAGLILTCTAALYEKRGVESIAMKEFDFACGEIKTRISSRLHAHAQLLRSASGLFESADEITRETWTNFITRQKIERNLPGIQGIGYAIIILPNQLALHEREIRNEGFPQYAVKPIGKRDGYTSVIYIEPFSDRNLRAFGYDMFSEPIRRKAMEHARDFDEATLSGKITLVQETGNDIQAGTLIYVPVYERGLPVRTIEERRRAIRGWVYSPYRMNNLMRGILGAWELGQGRQIRLEVFDNKSFQPEALLYDSGPGQKHELTSVTMFSEQTSILFNDHRWSLRFTQLSDPTGSVDYSKAWYVLIGGTLVSALIYALYFLLIIANDREQTVAEALTRELRESTDRKRVEEVLRESEEQFRAIFDSANDGILIADTQNKKFLKGNSSICSMLGYTKEEIESLTIYDIHPPNDISHVLDEFKKQITGEKALAEGLPVLRKDGTIFYADVSASPITFGGIPYIEGIFRDITERKRIREALQDSENRYRELSIVDDLTQLFNSRHFYFQLKIELDRSNRYKLPLTLLMLDLDNFKAFNDAYGHLEGDQVLMRLGQVLKGCLRETDFAYRYGGEEFTILLPMTIIADGAVTAERIRTEFKKETFSPVPGQDVHVTLSIGIAQYKQQEDLKAFVHRVDQLMYQGKKNGKDRVCCES